MKVKFIPYKGENIENISKREVMNQINNLSEEEGNFQTLNREDDFCIQWINLGKGIFHVENPISDKEIYYFEMRKSEMSSLIYLFFDDSKLENLHWKRLEIELID